MEFEGDRIEGDEEETKSEVEERLLEEREEGGNESPTFFDKESFCFWISLFLVVVTYEAASSTLILKVMTPISPGSKRVGSNWNENVTSNPSQLSSYPTKLPSSVSIPFLIVIGVESGGSLFFLKKNYLWIVISRREKEKRKKEKGKKKKEKRKKKKEKRKKKKRKEKKRKEKKRNMTLEQVLLSQLVCQTIQLGKWEQS